jgi:2-hydroxycyclohexanecarboxyl-CoA dehydrogenase
VRVAVVTGGGRGIGRAIGLALAREGWAVGALDLVADSAAAVAGEITVGGGRAVGLAADVTDLPAMQAACDAGERDLGPIGALVNNAGWDTLARFADGPPDLWDRVINVNLKGPLNTTYAVLPRMIERGAGRVVSISSDAGRVGSSGEAVYSECKAGVIGFSKALAREVARHGITVKCVCPGPTETALLESVMAGEQGQKVLAGMRRAVPLGRLGRPEDIAPAVVYLLSDGAAYVTGQVLSVSGGLTMQG